MSKRVMQAMILAEGNYGKVIMERRVSLGWSRELLAELYGNVLRDREVTVKAIEKMEKYNDVPKNARRRLILAGLLGLAPAALGLQPFTGMLEDMITPSLKNGPIDIEEYRSALTSLQGSLWSNEYEQIGMTVATIVDRIQALHNKVLYVGTNYKQTAMLQLLSGYHLLLADIASEHQCLDAEEYYNKAVVIARDHQLDQHYATALFGRGIFFLDTNGNASAAKDDFTQALTIKNIPPQLRGSITASMGVANARCAQSQQEITNALSMMDDAAELTEKNIEATYQMKFDQDRWYLDRAEVLLGSPLRECRQPDNALRDLEEVTFTGEPRRVAYREAESDILSARTYIDKNDHPFATKLAQDALSIIDEIHYQTLLPHITAIHTMLKESKYGKSRSVAELGVELMKVQNPNVFA